LRVLYISYDGVLEPLGQSQVLAYLEKLAVENIIILISFEKKNLINNFGLKEKLRARLRIINVTWIPLRYHKSPLVIATALDIAFGAFVATYISLVRRPHIVHARSYVPALMALLIKRITGTKFLFDMRGFWADERTDGGLWPKNGRLYRLTKWFERFFLAAADHIVTLTYSSLVPLRALHPQVEKLPPITVIPTCVDLVRFAPFGITRSREEFTLGYVGSLGTWYLLDEMLTVFKVLQGCRAGAKLLIVNRSEHAKVAAAAANLDIDPSRIEIISAVFSDVPSLINRMDVGLMLIKPCFSKIASAPTKMAEYLACGVPCFGNIGVGDVEKILESNDVGVVLKGFDPLNIDKAIERMLTLLDDPQTAVRCRATALRLFSLEEGVQRYAQVYESMLSSKN
jgi:glycosyltransferase involved in cell wall biosynthesis